MTAHVAERGEGRGRVVLRLTGTRAVSEHAITAAIHVAKAFHSEIESLFVHDRQLADAAGYGFVRELVCGYGTTGGGPIDVDGIARRSELAARMLQRRVHELALGEDVPVQQRVVHDTPLRALSAACQMSGPWNVVALGEPFTIDSLAHLDVLFERVTGMTGVVIVGPRARGGGGPVVAVIEDEERVAGMLRTAERLARASGGDVVLAVAGQSRAAQAWLKEEVMRTAAGAGHPIGVVELGRAGGGTAMLAEALRRLRPGFVIAEHGGALVPLSGDLGSLGAALTCPLLVVR